MEKEQSRKGFPHNFPLQKGKACHKSCLEWMLWVAILFLKNIFPKPLSGLFSVRWEAGDKKEEEL